MGRKGYSTAEMSEAIALATVIGAQAAGERLRIQPRTVRRWCEIAGKAPADGITVTDWASLGELARSQVASSLAAGTIRPKDAAVIAAIADRNAVKPELPPAESSIQAFDTFIDWAVEAKYVTTEDEFHALQRQLIRNANAEDGQARRPAVLAWFSGRPEIPAGDVLEWAKSQTASIVTEHGSLAGLREAQARQRAEREEADRLQGERNKQAAAEWADQARRKLIAEAHAEVDRILAEHPELDT